MVKIKYLSMVTLASATFFLSACVIQNDTFPSRHSYHHGHLPSVNLSLVSYPYPYFYDRPFYFLDGIYYYGGFYRNGFYHYGNRRFRRGHFYTNGYRYYRGRRYRARNGVYGYYQNRSHYQRARGSLSNRRSLTRGRAYNAQRTNRQNRYNLVKDTRGWQNPRRTAPTHTLQRTRGVNPSRHYQPNSNHMRMQGVSRGHSTKGVRRERSRPVR